MKFLVYNAAGLTVPVDAEPGRFFRFECGEEECGKRVSIEGVIFGVTEGEFNEVLEETIRSNPDFSGISRIVSKRYVFKGKVNGREVKLPVESMDDFARRFMDEVLVLR